MGDAVLAALDKVSARQKEPAWCAGPSWRSPFSRRSALTAVIRRLQAYLLRWQQHNMVE